MADLASVLLIAGFFLACRGLIRVCESVAEKNS